ncbi:MAG: hypothetical protein AB7I50_17510 [Vicinamibacterales bacterium]
MTRTAGAIAALMLGLASASAAQVSVDDQRKALEQALKNATFTALIDLPIVKSMVVFPSGDLDVKVYREKLKFPPSIQKGERATIRKVEVEKDRIAVLVHNGGMSSFLNRNHYKNVAWDAYRVGSRIEIPFGRRLTAADLTPEALARTLAGVMTIDAFPVRAQAPAPAPVPARPAERTLVELIAVEVQPARARPGDELALTIRVRIGGLASGRTLEIVEERQLSFNGRPLFSTPRRAVESWGNGLHIMTYRFPLPDGAPDGVYTFTGSIRSPLGADSREALFTVSP